MIRVVKHYKVSISNIVTVNLDSDHKGAEAACKAIGGLLGKITSSQENDAVWKAMMGR